jgi:hypothetical protein
MISGLRGIHIRFAPETHGVPKATWQISAAYAVLGPLYYLASLTTLDAPELLFDFDRAPVAAAIGWTTVIGLAVFHLVALVMTLSRRAAGAALGVIGFGWVTPMVAALAIAAVPIGSGAMIISTLLLIAWTFWRAHATVRRVAFGHIVAIATERFKVEEGKMILISASALEGKTAVDRALENKGGFLVTIAEYGGAILVMIFGPLLLPLTITGGLDGGKSLPLVIWFISVAVFLAARRSICVWILLARAGGHAMAAEREAA